EAHTILGVFVMKAGSIEEARRIAAADPTVTEHRNTIDVHAWRGPAGIGDEYFKLHREQPDAPEGMGIHPVAIVLRGPAWSRGASQLAAHNDLIGRLRREGKLAAAGPVENDDVMVSLLVFKRIPLAEAQSLLKDDPAQSAGILLAEFHQWF